MIVQSLTRNQAQEFMREWADNGYVLPEIGNEFSQLREDLKTFYVKVDEEINAGNCVDKSDYYRDSRFGLLMYDYFLNQQNFSLSLRVAADTGFWRFLSVKVIPDVVGQRWGNDNESHFWSKPSRIWLRSLWWYVHLSWQGNIDDTQKVLSSKHFSTDTILQFEERTGRNGTYVNAYRQIIKYYSLVTEDMIKTANQNYQDLFRVVMKLNTVRLMVMDPALCEGGEEGYAKTLFADAGIQFQ